MSTVSATLRRSSLIRSISSSLDASSRSLHMSVDPINSSPPNQRPNLPLRCYNHTSKTMSTNHQIHSSTTYSAFRNKVSMTFEQQDDQDYVSPYSDFFANIEAGRSTLGTTEEMEKQILEIEEKYLDCGIPESALRFKTSSYGRFVLPPYVCPGEHRVTVKVPLSAIPFNNSSERVILLQIVGSRYNKDKDFLQLSAEKFASRIENVRYLVDTIEKIVAGARKLAKEFEEEDAMAAGGSKKLAQGGG
ncbi:hypothetical protein ACHAXN_011552 [Cyclotella atomus]